MYKTELILILRVCVSSSIQNLGEPLQSHVFQNLQSSPNNSILNYPLTLFYFFLILQLFSLSEPLQFLLLFLFLIIYSLNYSIGLLSGLPVSSLDLLQSTNHTAALVIFPSEILDYIISLFKPFSDLPNHSG